jgi:succinyl-CoA synthetase alpha subunit
MSILIDKDSRVLVQGITGSIGQVQTKWMLDYGTTVAAGVTPGKGGMQVHGVPVFDTAAEAVEQTGADISVFFVPALSVKDAFFENIDAGLNRIIVVPEHVPVHDVMAMRSYASTLKDVIALGPTTPGVITPGEAKAGIMPGSLFTPGNIGIISRSGTLSYEMAGLLTDAGIGQSTVVGMGADTVALTNLPELLALFEADEHTKAVVIVGEVGGMQEEKAAEFIAGRPDNFTKPTAAYIAGQNAPAGKRMGHAGAIVTRGQGTFASKHNALEKAGTTILETPQDVIAWAEEIVG